MAIRRLKFMFSLSKDSSIVFFGSGKVGFPSLKYLYQTYPKL